MPEQNPNLQHYLTRTVQELVTPDEHTISQGAQERHRIFSGLLMALVCHYWNGLKKGRGGTYPLNHNVDEKLKYCQNDYIGHNIAAIAVNGRGQVIDFEFNHNAIFNSSAEHAEARLVKRIYGLSQVMDAYSGSFDPIRGRNDYDTFEDVTIYTSLESCSQCSGVMALARVKEVVYLQADPGMYAIGHIMRNLTKKIEGVPESAGKLTAPRPIDGKAIDLPFSEELDNAYSAFVKQVKAEPFFIPKDPAKKPDNGASITSFLCTKAAYAIYERAQEWFFRLDTYDLKDRAYIPSLKHITSEGEVDCLVHNAVSNWEALERAKRFYMYATEAGRRGTPHP